MTGKTGLYIWADVKRLHSLADPSLLQSNFEWDGLTPVDTACLDRLFPLQSPTGEEGEGAGEKERCGSHTVVSDSVVGSEVEVIHGSHTVESDSVVESQVDVTPGEEVESVVEAAEVAVGSRRRVWFDLPPCTGEVGGSEASRYRSPHLYSSHAVLPSLPMIELASGADSSGSEVLSPYPRRRRIMTPAGLEFQEANQRRETRRQDRGGRRK